MVNPALQSMHSAVADSRDPKPGTTLVICAVDRTECGIGSGFSPQELVMDVRTLSPECAVAAQLTDTDIAEAAERGFRVIVNNRPDNEEPGQPSSRELEQAARLHGLAYYHVPVSGGIAEEAVSAFRQALAAHDGPALAFCKSGMRSAALWAMQAVAGSNIDAILETTRQAGYNLEALRPGLEFRSP